MNVAIIANCQGESIVKCAQAMSPRIHFEFINAAEIVNGARLADQVVAEFDHVLSQSFLQSYLKNAMVSKITYFPNLIYSGFHPDMTYVRGRKGQGEVEAIVGPMFSYHSALGVYAYLKGRTVDEAIGLFRPEVFSKLGYFEAAETANAELLAEGNSVGMPLGAMLDAWRRTGVFMYSFNHPHLDVMADITRKVLARAGIEILSWNAQEAIADPMKGMPIWPIYPGIAERFSTKGDFLFKLPFGTLDLPRFLQETYAELDKFDRHTIEPLNFSMDDFERKIGSNVPVVEGSKQGNPYAGKPKVQFWRNSVASVASADLDPVVDPRFTINPSDKLATAGSCFAQHIARTLAKSGFNYYVAEQSPEGMTAEEAHLQNYGTFSARFGNIYTVRQLLQLIERAEGRFIPEDSVWSRPDGRLVDPFRPQITPDGFATIEALEVSRARHLEAVREMLRDMKYFVFTLGLTEGWRSRHDGAVFPLAPGVAGGSPDLERYEFVNFSVDDIRSDMFQVIDLLKTINAECKIILTVSPVPLIATYEPRHALVATTYSKAVLRTVADMACRFYEHVEYFPSYEIIVGSYNRGAYFAEDLRDVTAEGVGHVMGVFMRRYTSEGNSTVSEQAAETAPRIEARSKAFDIICDEEAIANF